MNPLQFSIAINAKDAEEKLNKLKEMLDTMTKSSYSITLDVKGVNDLASALKKIGGEDMKSATEAVDKLNKSLASAGNKVKDFANVESFNNTLTQIKKIEEAISKIDYSKVGEKTGTINPRSEEMQKLQKMAEDLSIMMSKASAELFRMDPSAVNAFKSQVQGVFDSITRNLEAHSGAIGDYGFKRQLQEAKSQMDNLFKPDAFQNFSAGFATSINSITSLLQGALTVIEQKLTNIRQSIGESGFTELKNKANDAVKPLNELAEAFKNLTVSMGSNQELKNFMVGLGEVINNIRKIFGTDVGSKALGTEQMTKNIEINEQRIDAAAFKILNAMSEVKASLNSAKGAGLDDTDARVHKLKLWAEYIENVQTKLRSLREDKVALSQPGATQSILGPMFSTSMSEIKSLSNDVKQYASQQDKYTQKIKSDMALIEVFKQQLRDVREMNNNGNGGQFVNGLNEGLQKASNALYGFERQMQSFDAKSASKVMDNGWDTEYKKLIQDSLALIENTKTYKKMLDDVEALMNRLTAVNNTASNIQGVNPDKGFNAAANLEGFINKLAGLDSEELKNQKTVAALITEYGNLMRACTRAADAQERLNNAQLKKNQKSSDDAVAAKSKSMRQAAIEANKLTIRINELNSVMDRANAMKGKGFVIDTAELEDKINRLKSLLFTLNNLKQGITVSGGFQSTSEMKSSPLYINVKDDAKVQETAVLKQVAAAERADAQATKENAQSKQEASHATQKLAQDNSQLAQAIQNATNHARNQSQVLSDLKSMAMQYLSVYALQGFGKEMAQITGELELQQKSLEVILGNASYAAQMYGQIRDLSQMSPFAFMDLMKSTRQLAAFGIETKDLYGTMKALSDIGAGLNVDVNRLILAYGHTRSYGYLSGIQNRQFENAGIDMIGGLASKYNKEAEEAAKAARANNDVADSLKNVDVAAKRVTRKDIFKMMRNKEIPFADVEDVIMGLDQPGGKFYNMQQKQFDTLGGKLRNLANNYNIMMSELGKSHRGVLMGVVSMLTDVHENWKKYERIIYAVVAALGAMKVAQLAVGNATMAANRQIQSSYLLRRREAFSTAYLNARGGGSSTHFALTRGIGAQRSVIGAGNRDIEAIAQNKEISNLTKQRVALTARLTQAQREYLLVQTGVGAAEAKTIAAQGAIRRGLMSIALGFRAAASAAKAFVVSMLTNPVTWIMAAVGAIAWLNQKLGETSESAKNVRDAIADSVKTDIQGINQALSDYKGNFTTTTTTSRLNNTDITHEKVTFNPSGMNESDLNNMFQELSEKLQNQSPLYDGDLFDVLKFEDQAKQVEALLQKFKDIEHAKRVEDSYKDTLAKDIEKTGSDFWKFHWFRGEDVIENMKDYNKSVIDVQTFTIPESSFKHETEKGKAMIDAYVKELGVSRDQAVKELTVQDIGYEELFGLAISPDDADLESSVIKMKRQLETAVGDMQIPMQGLSVVIGDMLKEGDMTEAKTVFENTLNAMFIEAHVGNDQAREHLRFEAIQLISNALGDAGEQFQSEMLESMIGEMVVKKVRESINEKTKPEDVDSIVKKATQSAITSVKRQGKKVSDAVDNIVKNKGTGEFEKAGRNLADKLILSAQWQIDAQSVGLTVNPEIDIDRDAFNKKLWKKVEEFKTYLKEYNPTLQWALGINTEIKFTTNTKGVQKQIDAANKRLQKVFADFAKKKISEEEFKRLRDQLNEYKGYLQNLLDTFEYFDKQHLPHQQESKQKETKEPKKKEPKEKKEPEKKDQPDEQVQIWQKRINVIKKCYQAYKQWAKEVGKPAALKMVSHYFGKEMKEVGVTLDNVKNYITSIKNLRNQIASTYSAGSKKGDKYDPEARRALVGDLDSLLSDDALAALKERQKDIESETTEAMNHMLRRFEIYKSALESTGDSGLAKKLMGGLDYGFESTLEAFTTWMNNNIIDAFREQPEQTLKDFVGMNGTKTATDRDIREMSEEEIRDYVLKRLSYVHDDGTVGWVTNHTEEIISVLKKWKALLNEAEKANTDAYAKMMGSVKDYAQQLADANTEAMKSKAIIDSLPEEVRGAYTQRVDDRYRMKIAELDPMFKDFKSNPLLQLDRNAGRIYTEMTAMYKQMLSNRSITESDYSSKMKELDKAMQAISNAPLADWAVLLTEGVKGITNKRANAYTQQIDNAINRQTVARAAIKELTSKQEKAQEVGDYQQVTNLSAAIVENEARLNKAIEEETEARNKLNNVIKKGNEFEKEQKEIQAFLEGVKKVADAFSFLSDTFENLGLGDTAAGDIVRGSATMLNGAIQGASSVNALTSALGMAGPWGALAGAAIGMVSGIAQVHDEQLQKKIDDLNEDVSRIESYTETISKSRERSLGYDNGSVLSKYRDYWNGQNGTRTTWNNNWGFWSTGKNSAVMAMREYYGSLTQGASGYQQQLELLTKKREDYVEMYNLEADKKNASKEQLTEYQSQIAALDDEIMHFAEDLASELWSIDLKDWADQLSDALSSAWENGTSMIQAYGDTARSILQSVAKQMLSIGILQPMMDKLQKQLFGENGVFDANNPEESIGNVIEKVTQFFGNGGEGKAAISAATEFWEGIEQVLNQYGMTARDTGSSTLSSGIQGMSEETSDLLAGYVNALRQDVSIMRILQNNFVTQYWQDYMTMCTSAYSSIANIEQDVAAMRRVQESMSEHLETINTRLSRVTSGVEKLYIQ